MQETQVQFLGQEEPLEEATTTHSIILAWEIPWTEEPGGLHSPLGHKESDTTYNWAWMHITSYCNTFCVFIIIYLVYLLYSFLEYIFLSNSLNFPFPLKIEDWSIDDQIREH